MGRGHGRTDVPGLILAGAPPPHRAPPPRRHRLQAGAASAPRVLAVYNYGSAVFFNSDEEVQRRGAN
jgi:hypothetical protein